MPRKKTPNAGHFKKGNPGRPKGTKNKHTKDSRATVHSIMAEFNYDPVTAQLKYHEQLVERAESYRQQLAKKIYIAPGSCHTHKLDKSDKGIELAKLLESRLEKVEREIARLADRLMPYTHPRLSNVEVEGDVKMTWADMAKAEGMDDS